MSKMKKYKIQGGGTLQVEEGSEFDIVAKLLTEIAKMNKED